MYPGNTQAGSPELQRVVDKLLQEEYRARVGERRDASRKPLARPLTIVPRDNDQLRISAFSRDISPSGIGAIGQDEFETGCVALIYIDDPCKPSAVLLAECRWCKPYGKSWFLSGWNFLAVQQG